MLRAKIEEAIAETISERFASIHRFLDRQIAYLDQQIAQQNAASDPNNPDNFIIYEKINNIKNLDEKELYGPQGKNKSPNTIDLKIHDFGERGSHYLEIEPIGGLAHLTNQSK